MADLSPAMQHALVGATNQGIRPKDIGRDCAFHPRTIAALKRRGLLHLGRNQKGRELWRPTDVGRGVVAAHVPTFLHRQSHRSGLRLVEGGRSGYTHQPWQAMYPDAGEVMR